MPIYTTLRASLEVIWCGSVASQLRITYREKNRSSIFTMAIA